MPPDLPRAFLVSQSASNLICRKNNALEKMWKLCPPPPFEISRYATVPHVQKFLWDSICHVNGPKE